MISHSDKVRLAVFLAVGLFAISSFAMAAELPVIGDMAPEFTLPSQDGSFVSLADFRGKWVVLYFYPKDETPACTLEAHNFQRDLPQYEHDRAVVIGISLDAPERNKNFCEKQGLSFKLLSDRTARVAHRYGSLHNILGIRYGARNTFLIDPDGRIFQVWTGTRPARQSQLVLNTLNHLQFP